MKTYVIIILNILISLPTAATSFNTNIYEKEATTVESFKSKVRIVRDTGEVEVFFEAKKNEGAYTLPRSMKDFTAAFNALEASKKPNGPNVTITADKKTQIIQTVQLNGKDDPKADQKKDIETQMSNEIDKLFK